MIKALARHALIAYLNGAGRNRISYSALVNQNTQLEGSNCIHAKSIVSGSRLGYGTFIGANSNLPRALIGRYTSIGPNVEVVTSTHPSRNFVSTHPAFYSLLRQAGFTYAASQRFEEERLIDGHTVHIGSDVWIGSRAILVGGIDIGHGAIIAAGAVVTRNVPPYSIVGGVPAKLLRSRFSPSQVEQLLRIGWWNWDPIKLKQKAHLFCDIEEFLSRATST